MIFILFCEGGFFMLNYFHLLKSETVVVSGCTEPAAVAFSFAVLKKYFSELLSISDFNNIKAELTVSKDVFRNASTAGLPYLSINGIHAVVSAGICSNKIDYNLFTKLSIIDKNKIIELSKKNNWLTVKPLNKKYIYIKSKLFYKNNYYEVEIKNKHNNIISIKKNNKEYFNLTNKKEVKVSGLKKIKKIAESNNNDIIKIAKYILETNGKLYEKFKTEDLAYTLAKIIEYRMIGKPIQVCTFTGSGNQCLFLSIPFYKLYKQKGDSIIPAFIFSLFTQIYLTQQKGRLSKYCGLTEKVSQALLAGLMYLNGKNLNYIKKRLDFIYDSTKGLLCEGAKQDCSNKALMCINNVYYTLLKV